MYIRRNSIGKPLKGICDALHRVILREKDGGEAPYDALFADQSAKCAEHGNPIFFHGDIRLKILSVCRHGDMKVGAEAIGYFVQAMQCGRIIFGAERYGVHRIGRKKISRDLIGKKGIAGKDIAFPKAFKEPLGIVIYDVCPKSCTDDHCLLRNFSSLYWNRDKLSIALSCFRDS